MKNSDDTIGNQTRDLPACSAVSQPTAPLRAPHFPVLPPKKEKTALNPILAPESSDKCVQFISPATHLSTLAAYVK